MAAQTQAPIIADNARAGLSWTPFGDLARTAKVAASWSVPVFGPGGLLGVITVLRSIAGRPKRDDLDLVTLYAGYAAAPSSGTGCWTRSPPATGCWRRSGRCWRRWPGRCRWPTA